MLRRIVVVLVVCASLGSLPAGASAEGTCPNEALRVEHGMTNLPDCRAYELVSPADKSGGSVAFGSELLGYPLGFTGAAASGEKVMFTSWQLFAGATGGPGNSYLSSRSAAGWLTANQSPPPRQAHPSLFTRAIVQDVTEDFSTEIFVTTEGFDPFDQDNPANGFQGLDVYALEPGGVLNWASRGNAEGSRTEPVEAAYAGRSANATHILFGTTGRLVPQAEGLLAGHALYDRTGGQSVLVDVNTDGSLTSACGAAIGSLAEGSVPPALFTAVSDDGSHIFFTSPDPAAFSSGQPSCHVPPQLYLRLDAERTVDISASQRTLSADPAGPQPAYFQGASADGARVFFESTQALTDDATPTGGSEYYLYEYDVPGEKLKLITPTRAVELGVARIATDGSHVYFIRSVAGQEELVLYANGQTTTIAKLSGAGGLRGDEGSTRLSSDGLHLVFTSAHVEGFDTNGQTAVYLYNAATGTLGCVSCRADGNPQLDSAGLGRADGGQPLNPNAFRDRYPLTANITGDGSRVFFETAEALVPQDVNGASDVYEWENGQVHLISAGRGRYRSSFVGSGHEGRDVFFSTADQLAPADVDDSTDIYDARVGGGFPGAPSPAEPCAGERCQGLPDAPPTTPFATSTALTGPGNISGQAAGTSTAARLRVSRSVQQGLTIGLTVQAPAAGRVSAAGAMVRSTRRTVARRGAYALKLKLTPRARSTLRHRHRLKLKLRVAFQAASGGGSSVLVSVTVKA
jgi:Tol biopolymer transport system component